MGLPALPPDDPKTDCRGGARHRSFRSRRQSRRLPRPPFHPPRLARRGWTFRESSRASRPAILKNDQLHHRLRFHCSLVLQANQKRRSVDFRFVVLGACFGFSALSVSESLYGMAGTLHRSACWSLRSSGLHPGWRQRPEPASPEKKIKKSPALPLLCPPPPDFPPSPP